jgi:hypothetical protein
MNKLSTGKSVVSALLLARVYRRSEVTACRLDRWLLQTPRLALVFTLPVRL